MRVKSEAVEIQSIAVGIQFLVVENQSLNVSSSNFIDSFINEI